MTTVTIRANWLRFILGGHLGGNIMPMMALETHCIYLFMLEDDIRLRRPDIFVVRMAGAYPVAVDTTDLCLEVDFAQLFPDERYMADITARIGAHWISLIIFC
jgi:hypothetical protein